MNIRSEEKYSQHSNKPSAEQQQHRSVFCRHQLIRPIEVFWHSIRIKIFYDIFGYFIHKILILRCSIVWVEDLRFCICKINSSNLWLCGREHGTFQFIGIQTFNGNNSYFIDDLFRRYFIRRKQGFLQTFFHQRDLQQIKKNHLNRLWFPVSTALLLYTVYFLGIQTVHNTRHILTINNKIVHLSSATSPI